MEETMRYMKSLTFRRLISVLIRRGPSHNILPHGSSVRNNHGPLSQRSPHDCNFYVL